MMDKNKLKEKLNNLKKKNYEEITVDFPYNAELEKEQLKKLDEIKEGIDKLEKKEFPQFPEIKFPEIPKVEIPPYPEQKEFPKEIKISNLEDIPQPIFSQEVVEFPEGLKQFKPLEFLKFIGDIISKATTVVRDVIIRNKKIEDYIPVRLVYKEGDKLFFDPAMGGGGSGGASLNTITLEAGDIEIGAVELKNGTDDTRATITAANALKIDGSAVTQPVSGTFYHVTQPVSG